MRRVLTAVLMVIWLMNAFFSVSAAENTAESGSVPVPSLQLIPRGKTSFTNVLLHYVYFDAEIQNAKKLKVRLLNPEGEQVAFRTRNHVNNHLNACKIVSYNLKKGQEKYENLNVLFQSNLTPGNWTIEVTALTADEKESAVQSLSVLIMAPQPLVLTRLGEAHAMISGLEGGEAIPVEKGKIRYIAQDPKSDLFVRDYWLSPAFDLRDIANTKCTRADFSMALSWLGIDCTPIRMSELVMTREMFYTYDHVCKKLGNIERVSGDLESLWAEYMAGRASPVLLHFDYDGGMHAVLLILRDEENPELFYAVNSGTRINTSSYPDGMTKDVLLPVLIEQGKTGQRIQTPLLKKYHKGVIDQIWQWKITETTTDPESESIKE